MVYNVSDPVLLQKTCIRCGAPRDNGDHSWCPICLMRQRELELDG